MEKSSLKSNGERTLPAILAWLCNRGFANCKIGTAKNTTLVGLTFGEAYDIVEARDASIYPQDIDNYTTETGDKGACIVARLSPNGSTTPWLVEAM